MKLNLELSKQIRAKYGNLFKPRECYQNVFRLLSRAREISLGQDTRVVYCYAFNGVFYYRHAFCLYQGEIIEPLENVVAGLRAAEIIPFAEFSTQEYYTLLCKDGKFDLADSLLKQEIVTINKNKQAMSKLNPVDMNHIVNRIAKTADEFLRQVENILSGRGIEADP